jgi:protein-tyrosine kinase
MSLVEQAMAKAKLQGANAPDAPQAPSEPVSSKEMGDKETPLGRARAPIDPDQKVATAAPRSKAATRRVARLHTKGLVFDTQQASLAAEEYRRIKRPLLNNVTAEQGITVQDANLVMVTSSIAGEGKTYTSINLALSIALERNQTVLLVDADAAKSDLSQLYGLKDAPGLIDLLLDDQLDLAQVLVKTDSPALSILPSGRKHVHATELLASKRMRELVTEMAERYSDRLIIFDSPPLLATSEAQVLPSLVGQVVLVVAADSTPRNMVEESAGMLDSSKAIGLVFNKVARRLGGKYCGGYYEYGPYHNP